MANLRELFCLHFGAPDINISHSILIHTALCANDAYCKKRAESLPRENVRWEPECHWRGQRRGRRYAAARISSNRFRSPQGLPATIPLPADPALPPRVNLDFFFESPPVLTNLRRHGPSLGAALRTWKMRWWLWVGRTLRNNHSQRTRPRKRFAGSLGSRASLPGKGSVPETSRPLGNHHANVVRPRE